MADPTAPSGLDLVNSVVTLVAAFAGAWFAFLFERSQKKREELTHRVAVANRAIYTLFNIWNVQEQYRKEIIEPHRGKPDAWLNMSASPTRHSGLVVFEAGELSFLLGTHGGTYSELLLEEQRISTVMQLIEARSRIILDEVWPAMSRAGIQLNEGIEEGVLKRILGVGTVRKLEVMTEGIVHNIDENLASLVALSPRLRNALQHHMSGQQLVRMEFRMPDPTPPAGGGTEEKR